MYTARQANCKGAFLAPLYPSSSFIHRIAKRIPAIRFSSFLSHGSRRAFAAWFPVLIRGDPAFLCGRISFPFYLHNLGDLCGGCLCISISLAFSGLSAVNVFRLLTCCEVLREILCLSGRAVIGMKFQNLGNRRRSVGAF